MNGTIDERTEALLESGLAGDAMLEGLAALDAERTVGADPIYPNLGANPLAAGEARDLARRFRTLRDEHVGALVAARSLLPSDPGRVAAAIFMEGAARMDGLAGDDLVAAQRELAEAMVDLQSFRPDAQAALILSGPDAPEAASALDALRTARASMIAAIREDPNVTGGRNALRDVEVRIGDARIALDAVNGYRERQAFGFLAILVVVALVVIAIVVFVLFVVTPAPS